MTLPKDLDPYTSPRAFYGAELRRSRAAAGLSQEQLGERLFCSGAYVGQLETAARRPQSDLSRMLDELLETGEHFQRLCHLARRSRHPDYFADAAELETRAKTISEYAPMLIPGFLQTEAYARALTRAARQFAPPAEIDGLVAARTERANLLDGPTAPELWGVIHEAALRVTVGGASAMGEQLQHLHALADTHHRVVVQVMPFRAGTSPLMNGTTILMTFTDAPPVTYTEGAYTGHLVDEPVLVASYQRACDLARAVALPPQASLAHIESVAEDWRSHEQRRTRPEQG